jgi:hypothetical protein
MRMDFFPLDVKRLILFKDPIFSSSSLSAMSPVPTESSSCLIGVPMRDFMIAGGSTGWCEFC